MLTMLEGRVAQDPGDSSAWRMLGTLRLKGGDVNGARQALARAVSLEPENAAAHYGLAECLLQAGSTEDARYHFSQAARIAPDSVYAQQAQAQLAALPDAEIDQAGYEVRTFDGSEQTEEILFDEPAASQQPIRFLLDVGAFYNSNVTLAPTARDFSQPDRESAQATFSPFVEYRFLQTDWWEMGAAFTGYFSVNENNAVGDLNLQSYQPALFVERSFVTDGAVMVSKLQYDFTLDEFDGMTFGRRHAATASLTSLWDSGSASVLYWTTDYTNFADDGATPATTSRDGWTHSLGASHSYPVAWSWVSAVNAGVDVQWADVRGADFRYLGTSLYVGTETLITDDLTFELEGGWGYRDYFDSAITPSRNETIWRASARLKQRWTDHLSTSAVFNFDQFDSANQQFEAERFLTGLLTTFEY